MKYVVIFALLAFAVGCVSMTPEQEMLYREAMKEGFPLCAWPHPAIAGALSILPGAGQFYNGQPGLGVVSVLFWPLSYFWSIPSAIHDAAVTRKIRTAELYRRKKETSR